MPRKRFFKLREKMEIAEYAVNCGNIHATARAYPMVSRYQIRSWIRLRTEMAQKIAQNPSAHTLHPGVMPYDLDLESTVLQWLKSQRAKGFPVSVNDVIVKSLTLQPQFKGGCMKTLCPWAYRFLRRWKLSIRRKTRTAQHLPAEAEAEKARFSDAFMRSLSLRNVQDSMFVNMDQTPLRFDSIPPTTIDDKGASTVAIRSGTSSNQRATLAITVAFDGAKLPLFLIFKGKPGGRIARELDRMQLPANVIATVQEKAWMDMRCMDIWFDKIWRPYAESTGKSVLLLDHFECHRHPAFAEKAGSIGTRVHIIPGGLTSVLQPLDVGVNSPFKLQYQRICQRWKIEEYHRRGGIGRMPVPMRKQVIDWVAQIWDSFPIATVRSSFRGSGFIIDTDRSNETESESE